MTSSARKPFAFTVLSIVAAASIGGVLPASAAPGVVGSFEIDGNLVDSAAGEPRDWDTIGSDPDATVLQFDDPSGKDDNSFGNGSKLLEPIGWSFVTQKVPKKDDILTGGVALREIGGKNWLYLYSQREFDKGSAFIGYEFNRSSATFDNDNDPATPQVPVRTPNDLLIFLQVQNGGTETVIDVFEWDGNHEIGTWKPIEGIAPVRGTDWEATTGQLSGGTFLLSEAAINLDVFDQTPSCPGLGKVWMHTISSHSFTTATMKDRTIRQDIDLSNCGSITIDKIDDLDEQPLDGALFEARLDNGDGVFMEATDPQVATCTTGEEGTAGRCTFEALGTGVYWVREIQAPSGFDPDPTVYGPVTLEPNEHEVIGDPFVNHKLLPAFSVTKTASPASVDLSDGDPTNDVVTYTITVTNVGDGDGATFVEDDYDQLHLTDVTLLTAGGVDDGDKIRWNDTGTIPAGKDASFSYTARITGTYGAADAGDGCEGEHRYPVVNLVTVDGDDASETVCVHAAPAFTVVKSADKQTAQLGEEVTYTITVNNTGPGEGSTSVIDDYDEAHLGDITAITPASGSDDGDTITWADSGPIASGDNVIFRYKGTLVGTFTGPSGTGGCADGEYPVLNEVTVTGGATSTATVCVPADPEWLVTKAVSPDQVDLTDGDTTNDTVTYTITVKNIGKAEGSTPVSDDYDQDHLTDIVLVTPGGSNDGDIISWGSGQIPPGETATFTYTARITGKFTGSPGLGGCADDRYPVVNTVSVDGDDDSATVCVLARPDFTVEKTVDPGSVDLTDGDTANDTVTYTITVTNAGAAEGSTPVNDDYDQDHLTDIVLVTAGGSNDGDIISWGSGQIPPGETVTFTYTARVTGGFTGPSGGEDCPAGSYPVVNLVQVDGASDSATVCVEAAPAFSVVKTATPETVDLSDDDPSNDTVTYEITVTNSGAAEGSTSVTDDYDQTHLTDVVLVTGGGTDDGDVITWPSGTLAPNGGSATFTYTARIIGPFDAEEAGEPCAEGSYPVVNDVSVDGATATATVCATASPAFEVTKTVDPTTVDLSDGSVDNDVVTYTITVTNVGQAEGGTSVSDDYDQAHLVEISDVDPAGTDDGDTITWSSGPITVGDSKTFSYSGRIVGPFSDEDAGEPCDEGSYPVINIVTVAGDEATAEVCASADPAFEVTKSASPNTVDLSDGNEANDVITYTITVTNTGQAEGTTQVVDDYDQNHLTDIASIEPNDGSDDGDTISWMSGPIDPVGGTATYSYTARVIGPFTSDEAGEPCEAGAFPVVNQVAVDGDSATETVCASASPDLRVAKSADKSVEQLGQDVTYTITVSNVGQGPGSTQVVDDYDQEHLTGITGIDPVTGVDDGDTITWADSGTIEPGDDAAFSYTGTLTGTFTGPDGQGGCGTGEFPVLNLVTIDGDEASETICVPAEPEFDVTKQADPVTIDLSDGDDTNDTVTYTITVKNKGKAQGSTSVVDDYDQAHLTDVSTDGSDDGDTITWSSGVLQPGEEVTFQYSGRIHGPFTSNEAGPGCEGANSFPVVNLVTVDGDSDTSTICINAEPRFEVVKVADPASVDLSDGDETNDRVTYTITVTNVGQGPGSTAVSDDYDQDHLIEIGGITPTSGVDDGDTIVWADSGVIEPGQDAAFSFSGRIVGPFAAEEQGEPCPEGFPIVNTVAVDGANDDEVLCAHGDPALALAKTVRNVTDDGAFEPTATAHPGDTIEYRIVVTNEGAVEATGVEVTDPVPAQSTFVSCEPMLSCGEDAGVVTWSVGSVPVGAEVTLTFQVVLDEDYEPGFTLIGNVAAATRDGGDGPVTSTPTTLTVTELSKAICLTNPVPGASITYSIPYGARGGDVSGVVLEDTLPDQVTFQSASPAPVSAPPVGGNGTVRWEFGALADGTDAVATITGLISPDALPGDILTNVVTLSANGVPPTTFTHETEVVDGGDADSRARGLTVDLLGSTRYGPEPDSDEGDGAVLDQKPGNGEIASVEILSVQEASATDPTDARANAIATTGEVKLLDQMAGPGEDWLVTATAVRAMSSSQADLASAGSSSAGSKLVNVTVDGQNIGTVTEPTTIEIVDPVLGTTTTVALLEQIRTGAADGVVQPVDGVFSSGLTVIGIHVRVTNSSGDVLTDVRLAQADSEASFLSGLACGEDVPHVAGTGFALGTTIDEDLLDDAGVLTAGEVARVMIPSTGGDEEATLEHTGPLTVGAQFLAETNAAFTRSTGQTSRAANTALANTHAQIHGLRLLGSGPDAALITADTVWATAHADDSADGGTVSGEAALEELVINGTNVCESLGSASRCRPEPNTTIDDVPGLLVILNEQIVGEQSITVHAIRIVVLGEDNPFNLPVGAEIIVASAHAAAHAVEVPEEPPVETIDPIPGSPEPVEQQADASLPSSTRREGPAGGGGLPRETRVPAAVLPEEPDLGLGI